VKKIVREFYLYLDRLKTPFTGGSLPREKIEMLEMYPIPNQPLSPPDFMGIGISNIKGGCNAMNHYMLRGGMERLLVSRAARRFLNK
jgi:hypothetical protein